jgi:hypothetical protein
MFKNKHTDLNIRIAYSATTTKSASTNFEIRIKFCVFDTHSDIFEGKNCGFILTL